MMDTNIKDSDEEKEINSENKPKNCKMEIIVKTNDERTFQITLDKESTLTDFRIKVESSTLIPIKEQRLISRGQILASDKDFESVKDQETPNVQVNQSKQASSAPAKPVKTTLPEKSVTVENFEKFWTLLANCEACIHAYQNDIPPQDRTRFNRPVEGDMVISHGQNPCAFDLGVLCERLANVIEDQGKIMSGCGDLIIHPDPSIPDQNYKVQLMMDCTRYLAVLNQTLSGFIVPLRRAAPRFLSYRSNPVAQRR
jgi:hypothetical protein